jgi:hypothetical protein
MFGYSFIKSTRLDEIKAKARQHDSLKVYTDDKIRELEAQNRALLEENANYRDALRSIHSSFNIQKQQQNYNSLENFNKKMNSKLKSIEEKFKL